MARYLSLAAAFALFLSSTGWAQCPVGTTTITADRDNTLYQDGGGTLSNGAGDYLFAGQTGNGDNVRGMLHFDVAGVVEPGMTITQAILQLVVSQPQNHGPQSISLHLVEADWGEGSSQGAMGEGGGGAATTGDATWIHTFFDTAFWTSVGGDFAEPASAATVVNSAVNGVNSWQSPAMVAEVQSWLDAPAANFGWLLLGDESTDATAVRFASRENAGDEPVLCLELCGGTSCEIFVDGFESGDTTAWDAAVP